MMIRRYFGVPDWNFGRRLEAFENLRKQLNLMNDAFMGVTPGRKAGVFPLINLTEDKNNYYLRAELPGVQSNDLDIQATGTTVSLSGERKIPAENNESKYHRREREAGKFSRMLNLSAEIDPERVDAILSDGILKVVLPKSEKTRPKQINIK
ncbi:MAG: Hsp20/alpha crystallin family protein [Deltaproteobacteria bacterium]|nr:MAG: Hsp20/alpha crystallin family protein [Deltaproteobacteria bacterium]